MEPSVSPGTLKAARSNGGNACVPGMIGSCASHKANGKTTISIARNKYLCITKIKNPPNRRGRIHYIIRASILLRSNFSPLKTNTPCSIAASDNMCICNRHRDKSRKIIPARRLISYTSEAKIFHIYWGFRLSSYDHDEISRNLAELKFRASRLFHQAIYAAF